MHKKLDYGYEDGDYMAAIMFRLEISFALHPRNAALDHVRFGRGKELSPGAFSKNWIYILYKSMDNVLFRLDRSVRMCRNS